MEGLDMINSTRTTSLTANTEGCHQSTGPRRFFAKAGGFGASADSDSKSYPKEQHRESSKQDALGSKDHLRNFWGP
jgi:hypothetical protein